MSLSPSVIESVSTITQPLALAGLVVVVLYGVFRLVLSLGIFPQLQAKHGAALLTRIVDRIFYLALTALVLGVGVYLVLKLRDGDRKEDSFPIEVAENSLKAFYARDAATLYAMLPETAKAVFPNVTTIEAQARRETFQVPDPPKFRTLRTSEVSGTGGVAIFKAEFDEVSVWQEQVSVARVGGVWKLWSVNTAPADWPQANAIYLLPYTSAAAFEDAALFNAQPSNSSEILQRWVPPPGWTIEIESPIRTLGKLTCDVKGRGSKAAFVLRAVLGGCRLKAGEHILVFGRVSAILKDTNTIEISTVRFFPTT